MQRLLAQILAIPADLFPGISIIHAARIARDLSENEPDILKCKGDAVLKKGQVIRKSLVESTPGGIDLVVQFAKSPAQLV